MQVDPHHERHLTPRDEVIARLQRLRKAMAEQAVDAVWIDHIAALYYFTGSVQSATLLVPADGTPRYVVRKSLERAWCESPLEPEPFAGRRALLELFRGCGARLGVALGAVSAADYLRMRSSLGDAEIVDVSEALRSLRMVKSSWEVAQIRRATGIAEAGFRVIPEVLRPGATELEVSVAVEAAMRRAGHQGYVRAASPGLEDFGPNVVSGDAALHPCKTNGSLGSVGLFPAATGGAGWRQVRAGDTVMADIASTFNGYTADTTRVFFAGSELPAAAARAHDFCVECLRRVERLMVAGAVCGEIYDEIDRWAEAEGKPKGFLGFGENRMKFIGHGVGIELDELPVLARGIATPLEPGTVVAVEPKAFLPGIGAVGVENSYVITDAGCHSLCGLGEDITLCP